MGRLRMCRNSATAQILWADLFRTDTGLRSLATRTDFVRGMVFLNLLGLLA